VALFGGYNVFAICFTIGRTYITETYKNS